MTMKEHQREKVRSRNESFVDKTATRIWGETPSDENPYIAKSALCHGYDLYELMQQCTFVEVFYLLFRGELPTPHEAKLLETLMVAFINPGPRHPATRAAMNAGVGKTLSTHVLPIALTVMGGDFLGGGDIEPAMRFVRKNQNKDPRVCANTALENPMADNRIAPGFGRYFGGVHIMSHEIAHRLLALPGAGKCLQWAQHFTEAVRESGYGWLPTGLAAAVFADLGFQPKAGAALFQLISAPGLAAHGIELANKPITAMPYVKDEDYVIEK